MIFNLGCHHSPVDREALYTSVTACPHLQVEVGGPFVGIEAHHCTPLLSRVSFFYPVANSLDRSQDYWTRDSSHVFTVAVVVGEEAPELLQAPAQSCTVSPYFVSYHYDTPSWRATISFEFFLNDPAMLVSATLQNNLPSPEQFQLRFHLDATLRTSHTYAIEERAWSEWLPESGALVVHYLAAATGPADLFVVNTAHQPTTWATDARALAARHSGRAASWVTAGEPLSRELVSRESPGPAVVASQYDKRLCPGETLAVRQIVGMCAHGESAALALKLRKTYADEVAALRRFVARKAFDEAKLELADSAAAQSAAWAKAVLAVNAHYLAGRIVPMPCPAQYNFFFTHDALLTDLAATMFDVGRVHRDLQFLASLVDSQNTLPHAYYWKDSTYVTEYAAADNWNHLWFVMVVGRYLRHSGDLATVRKLMPMVERSIRLALTHQHEDDLVWAYRPDWWDIGSSYGPRAYMTILTVVALREYVQLLLTTGKTDSLAHFEGLARRLQDALSSQLWDSTRGYLMNRLADGELDTHYYIGSLLAVSLGLLDEQKGRELLKTARRELVDPALGVRNVSPADFHRLIAKLRFHGDEAGPPYRYLNGGIWPHGNAWYALALNQLGERQEAYDFISATMSLRGVMNSPHGQPAMYEYRCSDISDSLQYGRIDKPQFLWAAGWYLHALLSTYGLGENEWNLLVDPFLPQGQEEFSADWFVWGKKVRVTVRGHGQFIQELLLDGRAYPSAVIPIAHPPKKRLDVRLGSLRSPYVAASTVTLRSAHFDKEARRLSVLLAAFPGHRGTITVMSPWPPAAVFGADGQTVPWTSQEKEGAYRITAHVTHRARLEQVTIEFVAPIAGQAKGARRPL